MKKHITKLLLGFAFLTGLISCKGDKKENNVAGEISFSEVTYLSDDSKFPNPERGFYKYTESTLETNPSALGEITMKAYRTQNITLIYRIYYLKAFRDKDLNAQALSQIDTDMAVLRSTGVKCVLRFAYSSQENEPDAPLDIVLRHLDQLKPVFEKNADVIAVLQAGFIGAWGEWYYSSNNLKTDGIRATILDKMLDALPERRMIQVRTPAYKTNYLQRNTPLTRSEAFTGSKAARIGHHNDCFLASATDYGTYENVQAQKEYLNTDALYVPVGGETCPPSGVSPADCQKAEQEMSDLHWSFLNDDYFKGVNDRWITQGCMDNIIRKLGYRFALISGKYTDKIAPGGTFNARLKITNSGYASPYNPRKAEFVLINNATKQIYAAETKENPGFWLPQAVTDIDVSLGIPKNMPQGTYGLYLNLPDPEPTLRGNRDFSVRLANKDVWDPDTGYNNLFQQIEIGDYASDNYNGNDFFSLKQ